MSKYFICLVMLSAVIGSSAFAADASALQNFVPAGWKMLSATTGDLNADGKDDAVIAIEKDDPANLKQNTIMGPPVLNLNPRRLLILFQKDGDYQTALSSDTFLPKENDEEIPCLADPFDKGEGLKISQGLLTIKLYYFTSCGSSGTSNQEYLFRYENDRFRLIGRNYYSLSRSSGDVKEYSVNYLTGKVKFTEGYNEFDETKSNPKTVWKEVKSNPPQYLDAVTHSGLLEEAY